MNAIRFVLVLIVAGLVGLVGYQIGLEQGLATIAPAGSPAVYPYYFTPLHFGFGFFGLLFPFLFLFLLFGLGRALFWGGRWGGHADRRAMLEDWHQRAHDETAQRSSPPGPR